MDFKTFITKEDYKIDQSKIDPIYKFNKNVQVEWQNTINLIKKNCKPFLKECKSQPLFRGIKVETNKKFLRTVSKEMFEIKTRKSRRPINFSENLPKNTYHIVFNTAFENVYGVPNIRTEKVVFATGDLSDSFAYGDNFLIFPIGKFTYWWSPNVDAGYYLYNNNFEFPETSKNKKEIINDQIEKFSSMLKRKKYRNTDLEKGIKSGKEIMITCDKYYAISLENKPRIVNTSDGRTIKRIDEKKIAKDFMKELY